MDDHKLSDLNNILFAQLKRLGDEGLTPEELTREIERSRAIGGIAKNVIENAKLVLDVSKATYNDIPSNKTPKMLDVS